MATITNCEECPLQKFKGQDIPVYRNGRAHHYVKYREVGYRGNRKADIVFIGESPGAVEVDIGKAFWGDSGKDVREILAKYKFNFDEDSFIMNACRCMLMKDKLSTALQNTVLECCRPAVETALKIIQPKLIVCLGAVALQQVIKKKGIQNKRGTVYPSPEFNCLVLPTYHPAYCMRRPEVKKYYEADLAQAMEIKRNNYIPKEENIDKNKKT